MIKHLAELCNQPVTTLLDARQARLRAALACFAKAETLSLPAWPVSRA